MFNATKKRAFFGHITILVPSTWTTGTYSDADNEDYSSANIVVHSDPSRQAPYTRQSEVCGLGGDQIFLFSSYIRAEKATVGPIARLPHGEISSKPEPSFYPSSCRQLIAHLLVYQLCVFVTKGE